MKTKRVRINDPANVKDEELKEAASIIKAGGLVAFPTETVYGLGGNALDADAARKIYAAKGRPSDNPLIAHISSRQELTLLTEEIPEAGQRLIKAFWPGPLTLIFPKSSQVPYSTTGGLDTVAVRMPEDLVARRLIALSGSPIAAPSANVSGRPSPTTADHVWQDLNGRIDMVIDGGPVGIGVESTIVDVSGQTPMVLRPGAVTVEMLKQVLGEVGLDPALSAPLKDHIRPKAPGMKYRHYAPKAELTLVQVKEAGQNENGEEDKMKRMIGKIQELAGEKLEKGEQVGIICTEESKACYKQGIVKSIGSRKNQESVAHNLYALLREFDDLQVDSIVSESFPADHLGQAIMNRLVKAAGYRIIQV